VLSLIYPLHKSLGHAESSQSSLVISWQRIYSSCIVTSTHIKASFCRLTSLFSVVRLCTHARFATLSQLRDSTLLYPLCTDPTENTVSQKFVGVFTAPLPRSGRPIVPRYASARACLATRCLAMIMARTTYKTILAIPFLLLRARIMDIA
jgi:hypothetical protein